MALNATSYAEIPKTDMRVILESMRVEIERLEMIRLEDRVLPHLEQSTKS
jgi:hypothetical protein